MFLYGFADKQPPHKFSDLKLVSTSAEKFLFREEFLTPLSGVPASSYEHQTRSLYCQNFTFCFCTMPFYNFPSLELFPGFLLRSRSPSQRLEVRLPSHEPAASSSGETFPTDTECGVLPPMPRKETRFPLESDSLSPFPQGSPGLLEKWGGLEFPAHVGPVSLRGELLRRGFFQLLLEGVFSARSVQKGYEDDN